MSTLDPNNKLREHICLNTKYLYRWLDGIGVNRVGQASVDRIAKYKMGLMQVLVDREVKLQVQQQLPAVISPETQALLEAVRQTL